MIDDNTQNLEAAPIILQANHLVKTYTQSSGRFGFGSTQIKALDDVNLSLKAGSTLAVVGESGSGKSTLARCLLQLHPFDSGEVLFEGKDLAKLDASSLRSMRKNLQMVFQDPFASLNPRMRVGEIVGEGLLIHGLGSASEQKNKVQQMLERVGLSGSDALKYPHQFSGGQRQRIGIARALVLQPKVVVCVSKSTLFFEAEAHVRFSKLFGKMICALPTRQETSHFFTTIATAKAVRTQRFKSPLGMQSPPSRTKI